MEKLDFSFQSRRYPDVTKLNARHVAEERSLCDISVCAEYDISNCPSKEFSLK